MTWEQAIAKMRGGNRVKRPDWDCYLTVDPQSGVVAAHYGNGAVTQYRSYRYAERAIDWIIMEGDDVET